MPNLTVTAGQLATGDVFEIAGTLTVTVQWVDPIGYTHVRIVGSVGDTPVPAEDVDLEATASVTVPADQEFYVTRRAEKQDCPECKGHGAIYERHPMWGNINCPQPDVEEKCGHCDGTGLVDGGL